MIKSLLCFALGVIFAFILLKPGQIWNGEFKEPLHFETFTRKTSSLVFHDKPLNGYVPDEKTAIAIAEAVIVPIYGKREMKRERPYKAKLKNDEIWVVWGSIPYRWLGIMGGSIQVEILKKDGRILNVYHSK